MNRKIDRQMDTKDRPAGKKETINRQKQTDRQAETDRQMNRQTDRQIDINGYKRQTRRKKEAINRQTQGNAGM